MIGQTVIVNDMAVIAVEAIEGTDPVSAARPLSAAGGDDGGQGGEAPAGHAVRRPDGRGADAAVDAGGGARVLAIEAGMTILLDEPAAVALADKLGIVIVSVKADELPLRLASVRRRRPGPGAPWWGMQGGPENITQSPCPPEACLGEHHRKGRVSKRGQRAGWPLTNTRELQSERCAARESSTLVPQRGHP